MIQPIFEIDENGDVVCRLPRNADGSARIPDGKRWLSIDQAAAITGHSVKRLFARYRATFSGFLEDDHSQETIVTAYPPFIRFGDVLINLDHVVSVTLNVRGAVILQTDVVPRDDTEDDPRLIALGGKDAKAATRFFTGEEFPDRSSVG